MTTDTFRDRHAGFWAALLMVAGPAICLLLASVHPAEAQTGNLLTNGDFTDWPISPPWTVDGAEATPADGSGAVLSGLASQATLTHVLVPLTGNKTYSAGITASRSAGNLVTGVVTLRFFDSRGFLLAEVDSPVAHLTDDPSVVSLTAVAPRGTAAARFILTISFAGRVPAWVVTVDDAYLVGAVPPTPTSTLTAPASGTPTSTPSPTPTPSSTPTLTPTVSPTNPPGSATAAPSPQTPSPTVAPASPSPTPTQATPDCAGLPDTGSQRKIVGCGRYVGAHDRDIEAGVPFRVYLTITLESAGDQVDTFPRRPEALPPIPGDPVEYPIPGLVPIYRQMTVTLEALGFEIEAPERTLEFGRESRRIEWQVRSEPGARGGQPATLKVYAGSRDLESNLLVVIPMEFEVKAPATGWLDRINSFVTDLRVTLGGLASLIAMGVGGYWWLRRRGWRQTPTE